MVKGLVGKLRTPAAQIVAATMIMMGGGYLIALWCVGLMLILGGLLFGLDAFFRDIVVDETDLSSHRALLRRYQNSP